MSLHVEMEVPSSIGAIRAAVEGLVLLNLELMRQADERGAPYPPLYQSGIMYRREPAGQEDWQSCDRMLAAGEGDCEDLSAYRVAELRRQGVDAFVDIVPTKRKTFHAIVATRDGQREDPSRRLIQKEAQAMGSDGNGKRAKPKITIKDCGSHYMGSIEIPMGGGQSIHCAELGFDPWSAITKVVDTVWNVVSNPAVSALLPPQAGLAIQIVKKISDMSPAGLQALLQDDRATDEQKKLASSVLSAKKAHEGADLGFGFSDLAKAALSPALYAIDQFTGGGSGQRPARSVRLTTTTAPAAQDSGGGGSRVTYPGGTVYPPAAAPGTVTTPQAPAGPAPAPGTVDPRTGLMWLIAPDGATGYWGRQPAPPAQAQPPAYPGMPPGYPPMPGYPGMPPGYPPMPGYPGMPPGYPPMPGYPGMPPGYGTMPGYPPAPMPGYPYGFGMPPPIDYGYGGGIPMMPGGWYGGGYDPSQAQPLSLEEAAAATLWGAQSFPPGAFPGYA